MEAPLTYQQLPARCIIVTQYGWCFNAEIISKGNQLAFRWCHSVLELIAYVNDWQLRKAGDVYRRLPQSCFWEPLSYEQVVALAEAEN